MTRLDKFAVLTIFLLAAVPGGLIVADTVRAEARDGAAKVEAAAEPPKVTVVPTPSRPAWTEVKGSGRVVQLTVSKPSKWDLAEEFGELIPAPDGRSATLLTDGKAGSRVKVFVTADGETARIVVVLGDGPVVDPPQPSDLVVKYKAALALDGNPQAAMALADSYLDVADKLDAERDTLLNRIANQGELVSYAQSRSAFRQVPQLPALLNVRKETGAFIGKANAADPITDANRASVANKYRTAGTALKEACK